MRTALGYLMTGRRMSARRAYELGLVNEVVPEAELDRCVHHWVEDVLRCAPLSVRAVKQAALESEHLSLPEAFAARYDRELERLQSADCEEGRWRSSSGESPSGVRTSAHESMCR